jgi:hypothetical protein
MLGVKRDNRESVHGSKKVVLTPNIGLEELQNRAWSEVSKTHNLQKRVQPAQAGEDDI